MGNHVENTAFSTDQLMQEIQRLADRVEQLSTRLAASNTAAPRLARQARAAMAHPELRSMPGRPRSSTPPRSCPGSPRSVFSWSSP